MANCEYGSQLSAYYDGELPSPVRAELELHLPHCAPCADELEALRDLSVAMNRMPAVGTLSAAGLGFLHEEVDRWNHERHDRLLMRFARALTAVAACLLIGASVWVFGSRQAPASPARPWEQVAVTMQTEIPTAGGADLAADWVVADASQPSVAE